MAASSSYPARSSDRARNAATQISTTLRTSPASTVEKLIKQFHRLDTRAEAFRYPVKKDGTLIRLPNVAIDLINLREVMEGLKNFFSGADGHLDQVCSASDDMPCC
jgi:hypothetical protein